MQPEEIVVRTVGKYLNSNNVRMCDFYKQYLQQTDVVSVAIEGSTQCDCQTKPKLFS